ncbi:VC0807 family protein [uncultured Friedmanniella sp.]|uniref:VC0807 family protein n=1 Tax=uncultured Friedmanniella sp. TaxID=335381 RepID=UPI0035CB1BCF
MTARHPVQTIDPIDPKETTMTAPTQAPSPEPGEGRTPPREDPGKGQMIGALMVNLFLDAGLAILAYGVARLLGYSPFVGLIAGTVVAGLRVVWVVVRERKIDPFAAFMMGIFAIGLLLSLVTGSPRFLLVKESFGTGAAGLAFVLTCLRGKPLAYHASQRVAAPTAEERDEWAQLWETEPVFRSRFRTMSLVIGGALLVEAVVRIPLIYVLPIDVMAVLSPVLTPVVITLTSIWAVHYGSATESVLAKAEQA